MLPPVRARVLGDTKVAVVGYPAINLVASESEESRLEVLEGAYSLQCRHWDTADIYGDSEEFIGSGKLEKTGKREDIFLATKFGIVLDSGGMTWSVNGTPEYAEQQLQRSLERLSVEYVDLWYLHRTDELVPIEVTVKAMAKQVAAGKVKHLGLCEVTALTLRRAHAVHPITAVQIQFSPLALDIEHTGLLATARELGVAIVAYNAHSRLGRGLLSCNVGSQKSLEDLDAHDGRRLDPRFSAEHFPAVLAALDGVRAIADAHGATPSQVAIAWVLAQGEDVLVLPGATTPKKIKDNMRAARIELTPEEVDEIRELAKTANAPRKQQPYGPLEPVPETPLLDESGDCVVT
ncbi:Aldo/keto reductase [Epithele typhae]|uniref:Aldo/keto reductase n=1 Tax=Epithele typhae TaxID=378194 RepID=UPI002008B670|nr:Aldo/keto reductase [Epithele typhae]KAH9930496.1 Aldo/keto reductase [Epithele typhae]